MMTPVTSVFHRTLKHDPVFIERASGCYLYTSDGAKILDACGGAAVINVGHCRPDVTAGLSDQLGKVSYVHSGAWATSPAEELAEMLVKGSGMERAVFYCSGSEAMEAAIKLSRQYHVENSQPQRVNFIAREQSYHGNTLGGLGLCRHTLRRSLYLDLFSSTFHAVSPCYEYQHKMETETNADYVERLASELEAKILYLGADTVAAFVAETVVGATSGSMPAVPGYFQAMRKVCDKYGVLLVLDEIMCGLGRTGKLHAWMHHDTRPDIQACGKAISGGYVPLSAVLLSKKVVDVMAVGSGAFNNGHTYQNSSLGCRAGLEVQKVVAREDLVEQCRVRGDQLKASLHRELDDLQFVGNIRGQGLFISVEFVKDKETKKSFGAHVPFATLVNDECLLRGVVLYPGKGTIDGERGDHILISPPFTISEEQIETIVSVLKESVIAVSDRFAS